MTVDRVEILKSKGRVAMMTLEAFAAIYKLRLVSGKKTLKASPGSATEPTRSGSPGTRPETSSRQ
jgi:hypothetical protein